MIKSRFSYLKLTALVAVFAMTLVPTPRASTATSRPSRVIAGADLASEERIIARYFDDLAAYDNQTAQLGKKARLVSSDLDAIQSRSDDLSGRLSGVQDAVREVVRKLKAASEWNDLDTNIAARITDPRDKSYFQQNSLKKLLEDTANDLTSHRNEIGAPLDNLRRKLTSRTFSPDGDVQIVLAAYAAPRPLMTSGLKCLVANVKLGLLWRVGGQESTKGRNERICACGGTGACTNAVT